MSRLMPGLLALVILAWGCGSTLHSTGRLDGDAEPDGTDVVTDVELDGEPDLPSDPEGCIADTYRCSADMLSLEHCRSDGSGWDAIPCDMRCIEEPEPHCGSWQISNIPDADLLTSGAMPPGEIWPRGDDYVANFDTVTGEINVTYRSDGTHVSEVRPPDIIGLHPESGIYFTIVDQSEGAPTLGVFSFESLNIPSYYTFRAYGVNALVILSEGDLDVHGGVEARCLYVDSVCMGACSAPGDGPGVGGDGSSVSGPSEDRDGGGGGGAYGGVGGIGGGFSPDLRGAGGEQYGTSELIPLLGGSSGGWGAGIGTRRWGGISGGALELVSGGTLTVHEGGWIDAGGCGGGPATDNEGGGGGGSGGGILLEASSISIAGTVTSNGGGGAAGGALIGTGQVYGKNSLLASDEPAPGGVPADPTSSCPGGNGSGAGTADGSSAPSCSDPTMYNAGGGGGGSGRIRINGFNISIPGMISPDMDSPTTTQSTLQLL